MPTKIHSSIQRLIEKPIIDFRIIYIIPYGLLIKCLWNAYKKLIACVFLMKWIVNCYLVRIFLMVILMMTMWALKMMAENFINPTGSG